MGGCLSLFGLPFGTQSPTMVSSVFAFFARALTRFLRTVMNAVFLSVGSELRTICALQSYGGIYSHPFRFKNKREIMKGKGKPNRSSFFFFAEETANRFEKGSAFCVHTLLFSKFWLHIAVCRPSSSFVHSNINIIVFYFFSFAEEQIRIRGTFSPNERINKQKKRRKKKAFNPWHTGIDAIITFSIKNKAQLSNLNLGRNKQTGKKKRCRPHNLTFCVFYSPHKANFQTEQS